MRLGSYRCTLSGAIAAFFLGIFQLVAPKGTLPHKTLGLIWVLIMATVAISSIFIRPAYYGYDLPLVQWFSFIHLFTVLTFWGVMQGSFFLLRGGPRLKRHAGSFIGMFIGGLVIAGGFAFLPGRIMHAVVFGS